LAASPTEPAESRRPIYVVDDSDDIRVAVVEALTALGMEAVPFATGPAALEAIAARQPGVLLVDLRMEPMAGDELCRKVKENRALTGIPVVVFTAADSAQEVMRTWRAGADDFLPKPIRLPQLKA
jgi:DNA-binding response OmpR family regulator